MHRSVATAASCSRYIVLSGIATHIILRVHAHRYSLTYFHACPYVA